VRIAGPEQPEELGAAAVVETLAGLGAIPFT
jgi:hypothetical protein